MEPRKTILPYGRQLVDDDDVAAVAAQLRDGFLTQGPTIAKFEAALCAITGAKHAVAVSSGTAALHLAALSAGVGRGDAVLVPDVTFVATSNAVRYAGGRPILVDVDPSTGLIDLDALEELADRVRPKAIFPVSFSGSPPDLARVRAIALRHNACVVEDAAHSLGATYSSSLGIHRSASCAHTDMAILSFHPVKHLTTGEGGAITTNDSALFEALSDLRSHGITKDPARLETNDGPWYYEQQRLGFNYRITDVQCALGVSQARKFPAFLARRRAIAARYDAAFAPHPSVLRPLGVPRGCVSAYHLYVIGLVPRQGEDLASVAARRKALFQALRERNVLPQVHYIPVHRQPDYRECGLAGGSFPGAEAYYAGCLSLPMFPAMTDDDVDYVASAVQDALRVG
jgi:UDP-4-amino-4,6-dideoxy-N-acetyl-beta-L-altrosamine transaminase